MTKEEYFYDMQNTLFDKGGTMILEFESKGNTEITITKILLMKKEN